MANKETVRVVILSDFTTWDTVEGCWILDISPETYAKLQSGEILPKDIDGCDEEAVPGLVRAHIAANHFFNA